MISDLQDRSDGQEMMLHQAPNQELGIDVPVSKEVAVGQKTHTIDMLELARRSDLRSSQIRVACEEEKELEKRVRGIRLKVNQKRDSVIMLRNVLKMKKDEVSELRKTVTHMEPARSTSSTQISRSSSWGVKQGCIFFPKIEFFINHSLEHRVFYK